MYLFWMWLVLCLLFSAANQSLIGFVYGTVVSLFLTPFVFVTVTIFSVPDACFDNDYTTQC